jgi:hypothetical protein
METDWEVMYRSWKEGYGWRNRVKMFNRCERWLEDMQENIWEGRPWGRMANYLVSARQENQDAPAVVAPANANANANMPGPAANDGLAVDNEDEEMQEVGNGDDAVGLNDYEQFQWP